MKQILLLAFILFTIFKVNAQSQCATDEYDAFLKRTNPTYAAERQKMEQQIYSILKNKQNNPNARIMQNDCQPNGVFTIPVVVHVMHTGEPIGTGINISDAQITNAIRGLNERWRRIIGDGVDMEIQFALAVRDTNGNATTGINRVNASSILLYSSQGIHIRDTLGANFYDVISLSRWAENRYLNIWVCNVPEICGLAGLGSSFVLMHYTCMTYSSNALAHEIGHCFNLNHTFAGDGSGGGLDPSTQCPANNDCLLDGDGVCDTPPHKKAECSTTSCATSGNLQNSFKNHMSYCGSTTRFTQGQKERVIVDLYNDYHWNLVNSDGLIPVTTPLEVGIVSIESNLTEPICNNFVPKIKIKNSGTTTITNLKIITYVDGLLNNIKIISTNLIKSTANTYNLNPIIFSNSGQHNLKFEINEMNGSTTDFQPINNQICKDILVRNNPENNICFNIEENNYNKILKQLDTINNPQLVSISGCSNIGNKAIKLDFFSNSRSYINKKFYLPQLNIDSVHTAYLTFDYSYKKGSVSSLIDLQFYIAECDSIPEYIAYFGNNSLVSVTGNDSLSPWVPTSCVQWKKDSINIPYYNGANNLQISIMYQNYTTQKTQNLYLDNFCIHKRYKITANLTPATAGFVTMSKSDGIYDDGSIATITAKSYGNCYQFSNWTENGVIVSTSPIYTFNVNKNRNLTANYINVSNQLTHPNSICLNLEDSSFNSIIIEQTLNNLSLVNITGCLSIGTKALKYDNSIVSANFNSGVYKRNPFYLTSFNLDSVYSAYLTFDRAFKQGAVNSKLYLSYSIIDGCDSMPKFLYFKSNNSLASITGRDSINTWIPTNCLHWQKDSMTITAYQGKKNMLIFGEAFNIGYVGNQPLYLDNFCIHKRYKVYANINYNGAGFYTYSNGNGVYDENSSATITATAYNCYIFKNWTENGVIVSTNPSYTFIVNKNRNLIANFERKLIPLSLSTYPQNIATVIGAGTYPCDTSIYISVRNIDTNYVFDYWYDSINNFYLWDSTSFAYISNVSHYYYTAYFRPKEYTLNVNTNYVGSPQFNYNYSLNLLYNSNYRLEADTTTRDCYKFKNWTKNGIVISTNPILNIVIRGNENYIANYERKQNIVTVTTNNTYGGSTSGAGTYNCGTYVTLNAVPNSCYNFKYWEENDILILSYNPSFTTYLYTDRNIKAVFEPKYRYNVILTPNPTNGGTVTGAGNFACDSLVTVKAKIKTGYKFTNWTEGSTIVSTDSNYTFLVSSARNLKANFSLLTGIKQTTINEISKVYPNPANDILQVEIRSKQNTSLTLNIIDMKGSLLETKTLTNTKGTFNTSFDVSKLAKGNYILNLYDEEGMASYKFIVQ